MNGLELKSLRKKYKLTQDELAKSLGVTRKTISLYENSIVPYERESELLHFFNTIENRNVTLNKTNVTPSSSNVIVNSEIDVDILQNKNGNIYYIKEDGEIEIEVVNLPFPAYASYLEIFTDENVVLEEFNKAKFSVDKIGRGYYMSFDIKGDSMWNEGGYDTPDGAKVLGREIGRHLWTKFKPEKYGYILMTVDNIYFKDIIDYNQQTGDLILHSRNSQYNDFTTNIDNVYRIFNVIKRTF